MKALFKSHLYLEGTYIKSITRGGQLLKKRTAINCDFTQRRESPSLINVYYDNKNSFDRFGVVMTSVAAEREVSRFNSQLGQIIN